MTYLSFMMKNCEFFERKIVQNMSTKSILNIVIFHPSGMYSSLFGKTYKPKTRFSFGYIPELRHVPPAVSSIIPCHWIESKSHFRMCVPKLNSYSFVIAKDPLFSSGAVVETWHESMKV